MYEIRFLHGLGITIVTETVLLFVSLRLIYGIDSRQLRTGRILACGVLCSGATLPYVWFVLPRFVHQFLFYVIAAESFAVLVESAIIHLVLEISWYKAFLVSLLCNLGSYVVGEILKQINPWTAI